MSDKKISELPLVSAINLDDVSILVSNGTDYQFAFTTLLQLIGSILNVGANISFGSTLPQNTVGKNGDVFINTNTGSFAQKTSGAWAIVYTLPSTNSLTDGTVLYGLGIPGNTIGNNNDTYINTGTGVFYKKSVSAWTQVFSMQSGPQGPQGIAGANGSNGTNGNSILSGNNNPSNLDDGVNGDFYINTASNTIFGPKASSDWGTGTSLFGTGFPSGGTTGQGLVKASYADFDTVWKDLVITNIYNADGQITGLRTVDLNGNGLNINNVTSGLGGSLSLSPINAGLIFSDTVSTAYINLSESIFEMASKNAVTNIGAGLYLNTIKGSDGDPLNYIADDYGIGLQNFADYSGSYSANPLALAQAGWVQDLVDDGVNIYNSNGTLIGNRVVTQGLNSMQFVANNSTVTARSNLQPDTIQLIVQNNTGSTENGQLVLSESTATLGTNKGSGFQSITAFRNSPMLIEDDITLTGVVYNADYSANFTIRSLVDKGYVDTKVGAIDFSPYELKSNKGAANGYAPLNAATKIDATYLPSYVSDVVTVANFAALPGTGTAGFIYITADDNKEYRWNAGTSAYIELVPSPGTTDALAEGSTNLYYTDARVAAYGSANGFLDNVYNSNGTLTTDRLFTTAGKVLTIATSGGAGVGSILSLNGGSQSVLGYNTSDPHQAALSIGATASIFNDDINSKGLEYGGNYHANYTNQSLVDKSYVDLAISSGIDSAVNVYNTDGSLTEDRTLDYNGHEFKIESTNSNSSFQIGDGNALLRAGTILGTGNFSGLVLSENSNTGAGLFYFDHVSTNSRQLIIDGDHGILITDDIGTKGANYAADYSANYTSRSLVDKGYVDSKVGSAVNLYNTDGTLTGNRQVILNGNNLRFGGAAAGVPYVGLNNSDLSLSWESAITGQLGFVISETSAYFEDSTHSKGLEYAGDYSANYSSRSLVDKAFVDAAISASGGISLTNISATSPVLWNNTTGVISIQSASGSQGGALSSTDWTTFNNKLSLAGGTLTGDVQQTILPVNSNSLITKAYVDAALSGLSWKQEVMVATTANITLSGEQTIDGITTSASRVLVKNQTTATQNGIYLTGSGSWTRTADADSSTEIGTATVLVRSGTANKDTQWTCSNTTDPTIGTDNITFAQIAAGGGTYTNGTGISLSGSTFSLDLTYTDARYANLNSPVFTGSPSLPTGTAGVLQTSGDNSTKLATTSFVAAALATKVSLTGAETIAGAKAFTSKISINAIGQVAYFGQSSPGADVYFSIQGLNAYDFGVSNSSGNFFFASNGTHALDFNTTGQVLLPSTSSGLLRVGSGGLLSTASTAAMNSTATATAANLAKGVITSTSAAATTITLPTATAMATH